MKIVTRIKWPVHAKSSAAKEWSVRLVAARKIQKEIQEHSVRKILTVNQIPAAFLSQQSIHCYLYASQNSPNTTSVRRCCTGKFGLEKNRTADLVNRDLSVRKKGKNTEQLYSMDAYK